jgi:Leucine-rich repeat (LRR) protein
MVHLEDEDDICVRLLAHDPASKVLVLKTARIVHRCPSFDYFLNAVRLNRSVETVIVGEQVVQMTSQDNLNELLEALGHLQTLKILEISLPHILEQKKLSGASLAHFLQHASQLETLVLWPFLLFANQGELEETAQALHGHRSLKTMALMHILLRHENPSTGATGPGADDDSAQRHQTFLRMDSLLDSLATIPHLETLHLAAGCRVNPQPGVDHPISVDILAKLLSTSASLKNLSLRNFGLTDDHCQRLIACMVNDSSKLEYLDVRFNSITVKGFRAFFDMLRCHNYVMKYLETSLEEISDLYDEIQFYLLLNRAGRFTFFKSETATKADCVDVLGRTEDNIDAIYYFLRRNPSLCENRSVHCCDEVARMML